MRLPALSKEARGLIVALGNDKGGLRESIAQLLRQNAQLFEPASGRVKLNSGKTSLKTSGTRFSRLKSCFSNSIDEKRFRKRKLRHPQAIPAHSAASKAVKDIFKPQYW